MKIKYIISSWYYYSLLSALWQTQTVQILMDFLQYSVFLILIMIVVTAIIVIIVKIILQNNNAKG